MGRMKIGTGLLTAAVLLAAPASAQEAVDSRWLPWLGCWEVAGEEGPMTCFVPSGDDDAVERVTFRDGDVRREVLRADGRSRTTSAEGCEGTQSLAFSGDERRVYTSLSLSCEGGDTRSSRSLLAFLGPDSWIDVTAADVAGREASWVTPYYPASPERVREAGVENPTVAREMAVESARYAAAGPITVDAIIDAHASVGAEAVRSWIGHRGEPLELDADRLVRLADAGVPPEVIDVAVAVSFPEEFQLSRQPDEMVEGRDRRRVAYGALWPYYGSYYGGLSAYNDPFYNRFGSPYRYSRFGWGYGYGGYGVPTVIVVRPLDETPDSNGRVVKGRGYSSGSSAAGAAVPRARNGGMNTSSGTKASSGSSSGSSSTGRKAKRRGNDG